MDYAGKFEFPVAPSDLWAAIERFDQFERWWSWLGDLKVEGEGLVPGSRLVGSVAPPLPYRMMVTVEMVRCEHPDLVVAEVGGDLVGPAELRISAAPGGSVAE